MKRIAAIALFVAATLVTTGTALAQNQAVKADVPFNFSVNGAWLPAGTYTVGEAGLRENEIHIGNQDKGIGALALGMVDTNDPASGGKLLFHRYGASYFLSEIRYAHSSTKIHLPVSKAEKKARERAMEATEASLRVNENVLIAMN
ncbi:MAG: hypothetical protein ABR987_14305 [Terracidiphilus sp.]|jgi:hypothetical protein